MNLPRPQTEMCTCACKWAHLHWLQHDNVARWGKTHKHIALLWQEQTVTPVPELDVIFHVCCPLWPVANVDYKPHDLMFQDFRILYNPTERLHTYWCTSKAVSSDPLLVLR